MVSTQKAIKQLKEVRKYAYKKKMRLAGEGWKKDWQLLITTIMSARSLDETTIPAAEALFRKYPTVQKLASAPVSEIAKIIKKVNFYRNKAKSVSGASKVLAEEYKGKVPLDMEKLLGLPGVGRKTANIILQERGGDAIAVDTHVFYCSRKLEWSKSGKPEGVEEDLIKLFPKSYWKELNPALVRFGKTYTSKREKDELLEEIKKIK